MAAGLWPFFPPCYVTDAVERAAKVALMTLFQSVQVPIFNHMAKMAQTCCCPTRWVSQTRREPGRRGPFFLGDLGDPNESIPVLESQESQPVAVRFRMARIASLDDNNNNVDVTPPPFPPHPYKGSARARP